MLFAGCASAPKPMAYDNSHSKAWNIATAAGLENIKDYEPTTDHTDRNAAALGGAYIGASQIPGVSFSMTDIGVGMLSSMLASGTKPQEAVDQMFIWMPAKMANNPEFARLLAANMVSKAIEKVSGEFLTGKVITNKYGPYGDTIFVHVNNDSNDKSYAYSSIHTPLNGYSPLWVGNYKAWKFGLEGKSGTRIGLIDIKSITKYKFSLAVSKELPGYFYIYLAPTTKHGPLILNQGKVLTFAKPKTVASN